MHSKPMKSPPKPAQARSKLPRSGVRGVYMKRLNLTIHDITRHRRLLNYIKIYYRRHHSMLGFSPSVLCLLDKMPNLCFVPCFFQAYTLCRICELDQISIQMLKSASPFKILSSKSSHLRSIPPLLPYKKKTLQAVDNNALLMVVSYDHLRNAIKHTRDLLHIKIGDNALDCTHIFRHLQATFLFDQGYSIEDISYKLGHKINKTSRCYIHIKPDEVFIQPF